MARPNPNFANWDGPGFKAGRDVPCQSCDATGICEDGEQIDVDDFRDCLCDHCDGSGIEPWRPAGGRDTSAPRFDTLSDGHLRGWRNRLARDKRESRAGHELEWVRKVHRETVTRLIGKPVLIELDVAESFAVARAAAHPAKQFDLGAFANRLFLGRAA